MECMADAMSSGYQTALSSGHQAKSKRMPRGQRGQRNKTQR
jgi:hypothetical protein